MFASATHRGLALIACEDQWLSQSFEMVFEQNGYAVERLASGRRALDVARRARHDVVLLDEGLQDLDGVGVCRALRDDPLFDHSTPIVIITSHPVMSHTRLGAFKAGAWEFCAQPVDLDALFLKLETFRGARQNHAALDPVVAMGSEDSLFHAFGMQEATRHLGARAARNHEPLACVALSRRATVRDIGRSAGNGDPRGVGAVADLLGAHGRRSDLIMRLGDSRLGICAPGTDTRGARLLIARLQHKLNEEYESVPVAEDVQLYAGFCAVADFGVAGLTVQDLLHRAEMALDHVSAGGDGDPILCFDDVAVVVAPTLS